MFPGWPCTTDSHYRAYQSRAAAEDLIAMRRHSIYSLHVQRWAVRYAACVEEPHKRGRLPPCLNIITSL